MFEFLNISIPQVGPARVRTNAVKLRTTFRGQVALPTPLVAYNLPWVTVSVRRARAIFNILDGLGIAAAGLKSEFTLVANDGDGRELDESSLPMELQVPPPPFCPYRPERYGLDLNDLRQARVIDVRLAAIKDALGLARYSPAMMRRWDRRASKMADEDALAYGGMNAMHWPPDISSRKQLVKKIEQLRLLNERALLSVSLDATRGLENVEWVIESGADILTLNGSDWPDEHSWELAKLVVEVSDRIAEHCSRLEIERVSLLIVPPSSVSVLDVVKLLALGADMVAVDGWCREFLELRKQGLSASDWAALNLGVRSKSLANEDDEVDFAPLESRLTLLREILEGIGIATTTELTREHLTCYRSDGHELLGVRSAV